MVSIGQKFSGLSCAWVESHSMDLFLQEALAENQIPQPFRLLAELAFMWLIWLRSYYFPGNLLEEGKSCTTSRGHLFGSILLSFSKPAMEGGVPIKIQNFPAFRCCISLILLLCFFFSFTLKDQCEYWAYLDNLG
jgi:hypothetical protein